MEKVLPSWTIMWLGKVFWRVSKGHEQQIFRAEYEWILGNEDYQNGVENSEISIELNISWKIRWSF